MRANPAVAKVMPYNNVTLDCFDGLRNFNQIRDGVFDGGYAFNDIPAGDYIVEAMTPLPATNCLKKKIKMWILARHQNPHQI